MLIKILSVLFLTTLTKACIPSVTTVSGTHRPERICSGQVIFEDNFDYFDLSKWQHEVTLGGGGNWEFQCEDSNYS